MFPRWSKSPGLEESISLNPGSLMKIHSSVSSRDDMQLANLICAAERDKQTVLPAFAPSLPSETNISFVRETFGFPNALKSHVLTFRWILSLP